MIKNKAKQENKQAEITKKHMQQSAYGAVSWEASQFSLEPLLQPKKKDLYTYAMNKNSFFKEICGLCIVYIKLIRTNFIILTCTCCHGS